MARSHPVMAAVYDLLMVPQDLLGMRKQRARLAGSATGRLLEVGVGTGGNLRFYERASEVVGIDPDPHMLRRARRRAVRAPRTAWLVEGDGQRLPFPDGTFDTAVVSLSLCTVPDPSAALHEIHRVLRPGGRLAFLEHVRSPNPRTARRQDRITPVWRRVAGGCHPNRPTVDSIEESGFSLDRLWRSRDGRGVIVQGVAQRR